MRKEVLKEPGFAGQIVEIIKSTRSIDEMTEKLKDFHDKDIAQSFELLNTAERNLLYSALDAVDLWSVIEESVKVKLRPMIDDETKTDIRLINSYEEDEIGSLITTNFICIKQNLTIRQAMHELVRQAGENDNISTIYVVDEKNRFCGAIDLKDLIIARESTKLETLISYAYPYLLDHEKISDTIQKIKDYAEDSLPVLDKNKKIVGIITSQDVVEADYIIVPRNGRFHCGRRF